MTGTREAALPTGESWPSLARANYALAVLFTAFVFSFLDRVILSMLMVPIQRELLFSDIELALLHGFAFAVFYALAGLPLGRLADISIRKHVIACGILVWSLCTAACGLARGFASLFAARVGVGIGEAALSPAAFSMLADLNPPHRRARAIATYQMGVTVGAGIAYVLGGLIIAFASSGHVLSVPLIGEMSAWRMTFVLVGLPGIAIALLALTMHEPARREDTGLAGATGELVGWLGANRRAMTCYALGFASINVSFNALIAWGPTWLTRVHGMTPAQIGLVLGGALVVAGGAGQLAGALRSDRLVSKGRRAAVLDTGLLCAVGLVPLSLATSAPTLGLAVILLGAMLFFACAAIGQAPSLIGQIAPNRLRGQVSAIFLFALNLIGAGVGPLAVALLTERAFADPNAVGWSMSITAAAGALLGAAFLAAGKAAVHSSAERLAATVGT